MHPTRIFKSPEELREAWNKYKDQLIEDSNKWEKIQYVGKDGNRVTDYPKVPLTLAGFEVYCYNNYGCVEQYFKNQGDLYNDFVPICSHIRKEIRADQIAGGLLGFYNPSITQRLNGLTDKKEVDHKGGINIPSVPDIGDRKK